MKTKRSLTGDIMRKKNKIFPVIIAGVLTAGICVFILFVFVRAVNSRHSSIPSSQDLYNEWNNKQYQKVYELTGIILSVKPAHNTALSFRGYSSYYLALAENDFTLVQNYIEEAINCIRTALLNCKTSAVPQLQYMLGKAYFQKDTSSNYHYYADLSAAYLLKSLQLGFSAPDLYEYLGLSYAKLGMAEESIKYFTRALPDRETDVLLLTIANQYYKTQRSYMAKQYLNRISNESQNELLINQSRLLMAEILLQENKLEEAAAEYKSIIDKDPENADAVYGLGVIYEKQGDTAKARSEWRKVLKIQVQHQGALKKLGLQHQ